MTVRKMLQAAYRRLPFKPEMFAALRKLPVPETVFKHLHFEGSFDVAVDQLHSFRMNHDGSSVQNELFWRGLSSYERTSIDLWGRLAAKASVIVDGGANAGLYSLVAGAVNPSATILAFEPLPDIYDHLVGNVRLNSFPIKAEKLALSDASGATTFHVSSNVVGSSLEARAVEPGASTIAVQTVRLDDYLTRHQLPGVDLIKLDVERHEPAVLRGMGEVLDRSRPTTITEVLPKRAIKGLFSRFDAGLRAAGYIVWHAL